MTCTKRIVTTAALLPEIPCTGTVTIRNPRGWYSATPAACSSPHPGCTALQIWKSRVLSIIKCPRRRKPLLYHWNLQVNKAMVGVGSICPVMIAYIGRTSPYMAYTETKIPLMYSFSGNSAASAPISTFMCVWAIYIVPWSVYIFPPAKYSRQTHRGNM